jgi:hypothetical protein
MLPMSLSVDPTTGRLLPSRSHADLLVLATVRLEVWAGDPDDGVRWHGTAFLVDDGDLELVTARHVLDGCSGFRFRLPLADADGHPLTGRTESFQMERIETGLAWWPHPDPSVDVAAAWVGPLLRHAKRQGAKPALAPIPLGWVADQAFLDDLSTAQPVAFAGYPDEVALDGEVAVVRRGSTASHPGLRHGRSDGFLLDAQVQPGASGSPVVLVNLAGVTRIVLGVVVARRVARRDTLDRAGAPVRSGVYLESMGIGDVVPSTAIREVIEEARTVRDHYRALCEAGHEGWAGVLHVDCPRCGGRCRGDGTEPPRWAALVRERSAW